VLGAKNVLDLAKQFTDLESFVHMSSIYANGNLSFIEEKIYAHNVDPQKIMNLLEWMEDEWINMATKRLIDGKPNTFTYTKWLSETLLQQEAAEDFPLVVLRPSTIGAAWKEPFAVCSFQAFTNFFID
jgi:nucleoside-diphosphate-sugar epimerase